MGDIQFNGTPEEWDALVKKNKEQVFDRSKYIAGIDPYAKQETLEEAAEKYWVKQPYNEDAFIAGAKWQQERMYSEEEVSEIAKDAYTMGRNNILIGVFNKWFEQFKKK